MSDLLRVRVVAGRVAWIESTATLVAVRKAAPRSNLTDAESLGNGVNQIADLLYASGGGKLVLDIHGYNNSYDQVFNRALKAADDEDFQNLLQKSGAVYCYYRWPSETIFQPLKIHSRMAKYRIAPLAGLLVLLPILIVYGVHRWLSPTLGDAVSLAFAAMLASVVIGFWLLKESVYFRDWYRAINYGSMDLVEFVRHLDKALHDRGLPRVQVSFVGHSMGSFVVLSAVRMLTEIFSDDAVDGSAAAESEAPVSSDLGRSLRLLNLVLVSPDLPVDVMVTGRANYFKPGIKRCRETILFSNGGDVVLNLVSSNANSMVYPWSAWFTRKRLGLAEVRDGKETELDRELRVEFGSHPLKSWTESTVTGTPFPAIDFVSVMDCTGLYSDGPSSRTHLALPTGGRHHGALRQIWLLIQYILPFPNRRDVHSGYFSQKQCYALIRMAALEGISCVSRAQLLRHSLDSLAIDPPPTDPDPESLMPMEDFVRELRNQLGIRLLPAAKSFPKKTF